LDQGRKLREGRFSELDLPNLADEIESIVRRDKRELTSCLTAVMTGRLRPPPEDAPIGLDPRFHAVLILRDSPSPRPLLPAILDDAFEIARIRADAESALPDTCPWTWEQVMDRAFLPEPFSSP
jgi:hypothetical protein